jgi:hypothetical protein
MAYSNTAAYEVIYATYEVIPSGNMQGNAMMVWGFLASVHVMRNP